MENSYSIFEFKSTLDFFTFIYDQALKAEPGLSMKKYALKLGIGYSSFKMIIAGKRKLTLTQMHQIITSLKLNDTESTYLEALTLKERAGNNSVFKYYSQRAQTAKETHKLQSHIVSDNDLLKDIYIIPILIYMYDCFKSKVSYPLPGPLINKISKKFGLTEKRVESALNLLCKLNLLRESASENEFHFIFDRLTKTFSQKEYLKAWLNEAAARVESSYNNPKTYFTATTISLNTSDLVNFKRELKLIFEKYMSVSSDKNTKSQIAQVCIQMFPLFKNIE